MKILILLLTATKTFISDESTHQKPITQLISKHMNYGVYIEWWVGWWFGCQFYQKTIMSDPSYPVPFSHKTFDLGGVVIDSNFDSGNLYNAERVNALSYNLWLAVDHVKNQYRTWFHFSVTGLKRGSIVTFTIKNMQNQSRLLNEGLVPVFREEGSEEWHRIAHKIELNKIEYNEGWIEWPFKHTLTSDSKVFFAFFYPWSNIENSRFLTSIEEKCKSQEDVYFKRSTIIRSLQGRPVEFVTISSKRGIYTKNEQFDDEHLFPDHSEPRQFLSDKKAFVIGARVHPGEVPSSHVMTGIITQLTENTEKARLLRDKFVFYLFPIFNPDGVARGAYRVDPNGINLNRCYINPSPKTHSPIYAVKKVIMHFHEKGKFCGFLDLHAHAARKGVFIYGNACNQLEKQTQICLFPKILSMNSEIFEYQGSNFTQKNMYCKDVNDHVSKQGAGRVALFKATKNPYSWTLQCNYNSSRVTNSLQEKRTKEEAVVRPTEKQLDVNLITTYRSPTFKEPKQFYTIETFRQLGKEICDSLLDLLEINPESRIDNPKSYFKSVQNLKLNLAVALLRMAPTRFQSPYKKIYYYLEGASSSKELEERSVRALYLMLIKKAKIQNLNAFLKEGDDSSVILPAKPKRMSLSPGREQSSPVKSIKQRPASKDVRIRITSVNPKVPNTQINPQEQPSSFLKLTKISNDLDVDSEDSEQMAGTMSQQIYLNLTSQQSQPQKRQLQSLKINSVFNCHMMPLNMESTYQRVFGKHQDMGLDLLRSYRKSINNQIRKLYPASNFRLIKSTVEGLPTLTANKIKAVVSIASLNHQGKLPRRKSNNQRNVLFVQ